MTKIRTLIVDDMALARQRVRRHLDQDAEIEVIGECAGGREAVESIRASAPDLMFLDVQMPETDGFEVIEAIGADAVPAVIFVTAYDQFALRAFEVHALDYLLKPFDADRLRTTLERAKAQIRSRRSAGADDRLRALLEEVRRTSKYIKRLAVKSAGRTVFLNVDDIEIVEAAGNYLRLVTGGEAHLIRERLSGLEAKLDPEKFVRIHRSTIINIDRAREMHPLFNGDQAVTMKNGKRLTMTRNYRDRLVALIEGL